MIEKDLLHLLENLDDHNALNAALVRLVVRETVRADESFGLLLKAAAIPRLLIPEVIGVLRKRPEDSSGNQTALVRLSSYPFIVPLSEAEGYVMHEVARAALLSDWRQDAEKATYQALSRRLAVYFEDKSDLLESLYHSFAFASKEAFEEFEDLFRVALISYRRTDAENLLAIARDQAVELSTEQQLWLAYYEAHFAIKMHHWSDAKKILKELLRKELSPDLEARCLHDFGHALDRLGVWEEAESALERALVKWEELGERYDKAKTLNYLGIVRHHRGKWQEGLSAYEDAIAIFDSLERYPDVAGTRCNLALAYKRRGQWSGALEAYEQARKGFRDANEEYNEARVLSNLGLLYSLRGQVERALSVLEQAVDVFRRLGDKHAEAGALDNLGIAHRKLGKIDQALVAHQQALEIFQSLDDQHGVAQVLVSRGDSYMKQGRWSEADYAYSQALIIFSNLGDPYWQATTMGRIGEWNVRQGGWAEGHRALEYCREILQDLGSNVNAAHALFWIGECYRGQAKWEKAQHSFENALDLLPSDSDRVLLARIHQALADLSARQGRRNQTVTYLRRAIEFWRKQL